MIENLESRVLMTAAPTTASMNGDWYLAGMDVGGSLTLNAGTVTGGSLTFGSGTTVAGNGTYTVGAGGALTLTTNEFVSSGLVNTTSDVFAVSNTTDDFPLVVAVKHTGVFSAADAAGTWSFYTNSNNGEATGSGKLILDAAGNVKAGSTYKSTIGTKPVTGSYTIDAAGNLTLDLFATNAAGVLAFTGAMNDSKNVAALGADDLDDRVADDGARMVVLVKQGAGMKTSDVKGTWKWVDGVGGGDVTFDGKGKVTGSLTTAGGPLTLTGTYSVAATGLVTLNIKATLNPGVNQTLYNFTLYAAINKDRNEIVSVQKPTTTGNLLSLNSMTTFTRAENYAPTLSTIQPISKAVQGVPFDITYATLAGKANESDLDPSDVTSGVGFVISSVDNTKGTLEVNGNPVVEDVTQVFPGDTITWTPSGTALGSVAAFTVRADDDSDISDKDIAVKITVVKKPVISISKSGTPSELPIKTGKFTISRAGGDLTTPLTVDYTVTGNAVAGDDYVALAGTVVIPAGKPSVVITLTPIDDGVGGAVKTVTVTLDAGSTYTVNPLLTKQSATLGILQPNHAPVVDDWSPDLSESPQHDYPMNYALFVGRLSASDPEGTTLVFKLKNIVGTLTINGVTVRAKTATVVAGDTLVWTPKAGTASGVTTMFDIAASDGTLTSVFKPATALIP
jgi:hypothetical protein